METHRFELATTRGRPVEAVQMGATVSAARVGKASRDWAHTKIEDNAFAATALSGQAIDDDIARNVLSNTFQAVRAESRDNDNLHAGTTAVGAVLTTDSLVTRNAGDSIIAAIGDNGKVVVLNRFDVSSDQHQRGALTNCLIPGRRQVLQEEQADPEEADYSWDAIREYIGTEHYAIAVMSDGVSRANTTDEVASDIAFLMARDELSIDDPKFSETLLTAVRNADAIPPHPHPKDDDIVIVTAKKPQIAQEQAVIFAFDGISQGGERSAIIADKAAKYAESMVDALIGRDVPLQGQEPLVAPEDIPASMRQPSASASSQQTGRQQLAAMIHEAFSNNRVESQTDGSQILQGESSWLKDVANALADERIFAISVMGGEDGKDITELRIPSESSGAFQQLWQEGRDVNGAPDHHISDVQNQGQQQGSSPPDQPVF